MKISIITPSFNQGEFIERTIQSVISQNCNYEYVVIDGGSIDQTLDVLKRYEDKIIWQSELDHGQSHAINKGLQMTSGEIIGWLNSDDIYHPGTLEKISNFFLANPEIDIVYGDAYLIDSNDQKIGFYPTEAWNLSRLTKRCFISQPAAFFRRRAVEQHGLLLESLQYCMDYEFWLRAGLRGAKFSYLPHIFAGARIHNKTKSFRNCIEATREANNILQNALGFLPNARLINYSIALVRANYGISSKIKFIFAIWLNLWITTGIYYQGSNRVFAWLGAQQAMVTELFNRGLAMWRKKLRYS